MITSIVLKGKYTLNVNASNKIKLDDNIVSIEKEIPFVRYRFDTYTEEDLVYIKNTMEKFKYSTHLIELNLNENTVGILNYLKENIQNIARFIYIDITDADIDAGSLNQSIITNLINAAAYNVDRVMLKDKSTKLDTINAKKFIDLLSKQSGIKKDNFGVCSSPLSFGDWCCLTAVRARELMTIYSSVSDVALPTANHQNMNCCGCIRYIVVNSDTEVVADSKTKERKTKSDNENGEEKQKTVKTVKATTFGSYNL